MTVQVVGAAGRRRRRSACWPRTSPPGRARSSGTSAPSRTAATRLIVTAQPPGAQPVSQSVGADRRPHALEPHRRRRRPFSPNGDGVNDTITFGFTLAAARAGPGGRPARRRRRRDGASRRSSAPGPQTVGWDGTSAGARLPDGDVRRVVTATDPLGTVSLLAAVHDRHDAAGADAVVDAGDAALPARRAGDRDRRRQRPDGGARPSPQGSFTLPWTGGPVTSFTRAARGTRPATRAPRSTGREPAQPRLVAALEPVEDLDQQLDAGRGRPSRRPATARGRR